MANPKSSAVAADVGNKNLDPILFRAFAEQAPDAFIFADTRGMIRFWNEGATSVFGYESNEVLGRSLDVIIPLQLRKAHWHGFYRAIEYGQTRLDRQAFATRTIHKDGEKLYVDLSFAIVKDRAEKVVGAVGIARDITSRFAADRALVKRVADLEALLTKLPKLGSSISTRGKSR